MDAGPGGGACGLDFPREVRRRFSPDTRGVFFFDGVGMGGCHCVGKLRESANMGDDESGILLQSLEVHFDGLLGDDDFRECRQGGEDRPAARGGEIVENRFAIHPPDQHCIVEQLVARFDVLHAEHLPEAVKSVLFLRSKAVSSHRTPGPRCYLTFTGSFFVSMATTLAWAASTSPAFRVRSGGGSRKMSKHWQLKLKSAY
jgi:hypothetical protein